MKASLSQKPHLQRHIKSVHEGQKFPCPHCEYQVTKKTLLQKRIKLVHNEDYYSLNMQMQIILGRIASVSHNHTAQSTRLGYLQWQRKPDQSFSRFGIVSGVWFYQSTYFSSIKMFRELLIYLHVWHLVLKMLSSCRQLIAIEMEMKSLYFIE